MSGVITFLYRTCIFLLSILSVVCGVEESSLEVLCLVAEFDHPSAGVVYPSAGVVYPSAGVVYPSAGVVYPSVGVGHSSAGVGYLSPPSLPAANIHGNPT